MAGTFGTEPFCLVQGFLANMEAIFEGFLGLCEPLGAICGEGIFRGRLGFGGSFQVIVPW